MKKVFGFTLAEVLITLGIIGVVAALTLPSLIQNHRKRVTEVKLAKFYSTMSQAFKLAENEHDNVQYWDWPADNSQLEVWYEKYLDKHVISLKKTYDSGNVYSIFLPDGSAVRLSMSGGYMHFNFYIKNPTNNSGTVGIDKFVFGLNQELSPVFNTYGASVTDENTLKNNSLYGCYNKNATSGNVYCARLIQANGWKIPDDYPFKF